MQTTNLFSQVQETVQKYGMLVPGERLLVACSGGADSVGLLYLLNEIAPRLKIRLALVHFDHRLRPESRDDFKFVQALAARLGIPFYGAGRRKNLRALKEGLSPEEGARKIRYEFFLEVTRKTHIKKMALGHHQDDQAETVLMRLIQGTGLRGLQGIRPVVELKGMTFIRPLIEAGRGEIRSFLKAQSIVYREDATNQSKRFLRNRIRNRLLPLLEKEFNPKIREALCRLAETSHREFSSLDEWAHKEGKSFIKAHRKGTVWFDRENLLRLPGSLQFRLLDQFLHQLDSRSGLDFKSWAKIEEGLQKRRFRMTLPRNVDLNLTPKRFFIKTGKMKRGLRLGSKK